MAKKLSKEQVRETRETRSQERAAEATKANAPARQAVEVRNDALKEHIRTSREEELDAVVEDDKRRAGPQDKKPFLLDGKPGSGAGLKPGDLFAPKSNPGAAARVPMQPLQPESLQSHGLGILYDKDLDNPPYNTGDPLVTDEGPSGVMDEEQSKAEAKKAEKATSRSKTLDPDNPTIDGRGRGDATASPNPIGSSQRSKNAVAGGSNSGIDR